MQHVPVTFKLYFDAQNIRRLTIQPSTLESLQDRLSSMYPDFYHPELTFTYTDSDGDSCAVTTEPEYQEMLHLFSESRLVKINVVSKNSKKFFRDGPAPEVVGLFKDEAPAQENSVADFATRALESLFPNGKILPYNMPSFLLEDGAVEIKTNPDDTVDLKTDIKKFFSALTTEACRLMETPQAQGALTKAKQLLAAQQILDPCQPITSYNLACVEALTGNAQQAFQWLEQACQNGYQNLSWMVQDPDLAALRGREEWDNLIAKLKSVTNSTAPVQETPVPVPEPVSEPQVAVPEVTQPQVLEVASGEPEAALDTDKWASQLQVLHDMGFLSDSLLIPSLEKHGSVEGALADLLG